MEISEDLYDLEEERQKAHKPKQFLSSLLITGIFSMYSYVVNCFFPKT